MSAGAVLVIGENNVYTSGFSLTLGASSFTVTNPGAAILSGTTVRLALKTPAENAGTSLAALAATVGYVEYAGSPIGNLTPDFIGQRCQDTTTGLFYIAQTVTSAGWRLNLSGAVSSGTLTGVYGADGVTILSLANTYTWAQLQALSSPTAGQRAYVSDLGNAEFIYSGSRWTRSTPIVLGQSGIPIIMQSSGSIGNNGALTGLTALQVTYPNCYMYFPVNTIAAGVAAGWYYVVMSSTTAGTIYNNLLNPANPTVPASPTAFATTGPGAYTQQTAAAITAVSVTIPANLLGANGGYQLFADWNTNATVGTKFRYAGLGASNSNVIASGALNGVGATILRDHKEVRNRGSATRQVTFNASSGNDFSANGNTVNTILTIDTTADVVATFAMQLGTATDYMMLDSWAIIATPGA